MTGFASYLMTRRLFTTSERGLATLRIKAFRHVHDLPLLTQNTERRGALVARVTSDVDQVSQFLVFGGLIFVVSIGQVLVATVVMAFYSWQLTIVVWVCFAPLFLSLRYFQRKLSAAYGVVRRQVGIMLSAISEPVVGAAVVRAYAVEGRTQARIDEAIDAHKAASTRAQGFTAFSFSLGGISAGLANAGVIVVGVWLGFADQITAGEVLAFAYLVTLFVGPVQMGTQILTDAQNAIAGLASRDRHPRDPGRPRRPRRGRRGAAARAARTCASTTSPSPTPTARRCCATSTSRSRRAPASRSSARPARASRPSPSC